VYGEFNLTKSGGKKELSGEREKIAQRIYVRRDDSFSRELHGALSSTYQQFSFLI
jgi:hypothetical protein